jgi:hypothetical protein
MLPTEGATLEPEMIGFPVLPRLVFPGMMTPSVGSNHIQGPSGVAPYSYPGASTSDNITFYAGGTINNSTDGPRAAATAVVSGEDDEDSLGPSEKYFAMYQNPPDFYSDKKIDPWKKGRF